MMKVREEGFTVGSEAYTQIVGQLQRAYPSEACGVLLCSTEGERADRVIPLSNAADADKRGAHFRTDSMEVYKAEAAAEAEGYRVIGFYHSHPDAEAVPSDEDEEYMIPGMFYLIIPVICGVAGKGRTYRKEAG